MIKSFYNGSLKTLKGNLAMLENTNVLEEALQTANTTIGELKEEIKESNLTLMEEKSCSSKIKDEKLAVEAKLDESLKTIESLQCSIDGKKDVEGLENQLKEVSETKSQLEKQIQDENVKYVQDLTQLKSEIEERKNRELELKADVQRLQNIEQYCDSLKADLNSAEANNANRIVQLEAAHSDSLKSVAMRAAKAEAILINLKAY